MSTINSLQTTVPSCTTLETGVAIYGTSNSVPWVFGRGMGQGQRSGGFNSQGPLPKDPLQISMTQAMMGEGAMEVRLPLVEI